MTNGSTNRPPGEPPEAGPYQYISEWLQAASEEHQDEVFKRVLLGKPVTCLTRMNLMMTFLIDIGNPYCMERLLEGRQEFLEALVTELEGRITGYIYLIHCKEFDAYKIGRAKRPFQRSSTLQIQLPYPIEIVHLIPAEDPIKAEKYLHAMFEPERLNGEWFELSEENVDHIRQMGSHEFREPSLNQYDQPWEDRETWEWIVANT